MNLSISRHLVLNQSPINMILLITQLPYKFVLSMDPLLNHKKRAQLKGQIISKCLFGVFNFHQKTNEKQVDLSFHSSKVKLFRLFFGGNVYLKKSFRLFLTFSMLHQKVCQPIVKTWIFSCTILNDDWQHYLHILLHSVSF